MRLAKPILVIGGTAVGLVGLGAVVFARLFQWADQRSRSRAHCHTR